MLLHGEGGNLSRAPLSEHSHRAGVTASRVVLDHHNTTPTTTTNLANVMMDEAGSFCTRCLTAATESWSPHTYMSNRREAPSV